VDLWTAAARLPTSSTRPTAETNRSGQMMCYRNRSSPSAIDRGAFIMGHYRGLAQGLALPRAVQAVGGSPGLPAVPRGTESARPRARQARRRPFCRRWAAEGSSSGTRQFPAETGPCQDRLSCARNHPVRGPASATLITYPAWPIALGLQCARLPICGSSIASLPVLSRPCWRRDARLVFHPCYWMGSSEYVSSAKK